MKALAASLLIVLAGCAAASAHTADRLDNAGVAAEHQADIEVCLAAAKASKTADAGTDKITSDFDACLAAADKKAGKQ